MNWETLLGGAIGAGIFGVVLKIIDVLASRNKTRADAAKTIVEGGAAAVTSVRELLEDYDKIIDRHTATIERLQKRVDEAESGRQERIRTIAELQEANEALSAGITALNVKVSRDVVETGILRDEVQALRQQVAESATKYAELRKKYEDSKQAIILIFEQNPNLNIPPELATLLGDSINGLKLKKLNKA